MAEKKPDPRADRAADKGRELHRVKQPYASELDDRELEHAHQEKRPVEPGGKATGGEPKAR